MEDLIGLLVFAVITIFAAAARYKEAQRAKKDLAPPPPPKPRQPLPPKTRRQFERHEIPVARPAPGPREMRGRPATPEQQLKQRRPASVGQVPPPARPATGARPVPRPSLQQQPVASEEERPRLRPEQFRIHRRMIGIEEGGEEREPARELPKPAKPEPAVTAPAARDQRRAALPPLFQDMEGVRQGIIFSEIIGPPLALR